MRDTYTPVMNDQENIRGREKIEKIRGRKYPQGIGRR
jgi:hypothetical protein